MNFKKLNTIPKVFILLIICTFLSSCNFFEDPLGTCELLSTYTKDEEDIHYINGTIKITNTGKINIYNSTINMQAKTNIRTYYKTISLDIIIQPDKSVYIPVELDFTQKTTETPKETWEINSFVLLSESYK